MPIRALGLRLVTDFLSVESFVSLCTNTFGNAVRNLALQYPKSSFNNGPLIIYLTARDQTRGDEALEASQNDSALKSVLSSGGGPVDLKYHQLDITDEKSIQDFKDFLSKEHPEGVDFVINNAGVLFKGAGKQHCSHLQVLYFPDQANLRPKILEDSKVVEDTLRVNYFGTLNATHAFLPLFKSTGGRLVNVSSSAGSLGRYPAELRTRFQNAQSESDVTSLMNEFQEAFAAGTHSKKGWPNVAYPVSKAGLTAATKVIAREARAENQGLLVNACCPGYVRPDMTSSAAMKSPDQGAQTPVMLTLQDIGGQSGEFWMNERVTAW